jgi:hypothetical protein
MPATGALPAPGPDRSQPTSAKLGRQQDLALFRSVAGRHLTRAISDTELLRSGDARIRAIALARVRATGAGVVRITVNWSRVVSQAPRAAFVARDPGDRDYDFASVDASVRDAVSAGLAPLLVVAHAPIFAEERPVWSYALRGSWVPDPRAFGAFATALASRYGGFFPDPLRPGRSLPRVRYFQAWNEPNLPRYLQPQWVVRAGRWTPFAPAHYRAMLNAFYDGVKAVRRDDLVAAAGLAPVGEPRDGLGRMSPVRFLHEMLCLRPAPSFAARGCANPAHFDALAIHPLSVSDPDTPAQSSLDVSIADMAKVTTALAAAERVRLALPAGRKRLWVTELNWQSSPPSPTGVPERLQAHWVSRALHRLWVAGAELVAWQFLEDPDLRLRQPEGEVEAEERPAGLYFRSAAGVAADRAKPFLRGFRFPFDPLRCDRDRVLIWGLVPPASGRYGVVEMLGRTGWRRLARLGIGRGGLVDSLLNLRGAATLRLATASDVSAPWKVSARGAF